MKPSMILQPSALNRASVFRHSILMDLQKVKKHHFLSFRPSPPVGCQKKSMVKVVSHIAIAIMPENM